MLLNVIFNAMTITNHTLPLKNHVLSRMVTVFFIFNENAKHVNMVNKIQIWNNNNYSIHSIITIESHYLYI